MKPLTYLLILASTLCTLSAQLMLKRVVNTPAAKIAMANEPLHFIVQAMCTPMTWLALSIQVAGYLIWLFVLGREKMAIAIAVSGSFFYILASGASWLFFSERLTMVQWCGIMLISAGVLMIAHRP